MYPVLGYPTLVDAAEALLAEGKSVEQIAALVDRAPVQVRASLSSRAHARTPRTVVLPMDLYRTLSEAAQARGLEAPELVLQLLHVIARDDVFDALLGEPGEAPSPPTAPPHEASDA
jgi:hypothetical protein